MEWIFEVPTTLLRVLVAGMLALTPGMLVWLVVLGAFLAIRWVGRSGPYRRLRHGSGTA
jgi:hypothetical protein